jgi:hypothetical protein
MALYGAVPLWLNQLGITPSQGHVRFYGLFFIPIGAVAGVLAVLVGTSRWLAPRKGTAKTAFFSLATYALGFVLLWLAFYLYSQLILGATMIVRFALIRATVTAALGALLFAVAPNAVHAVEARPWRRLLPWGYGLVLAGVVALLVAELTGAVLGMHVDVF